MIPVILSGHKGSNIYCQKFYQRDCSTTIVAGLQGTTKEKWHMALMIVSCQSFYLHLQREAPDETHTWNILNTATPENIGFIAPNMISLILNGNCKLNVCSLCFEVIYKVKKWVKVTT